MPQHRSSTSRPHPSAPAGQAARRRTRPPADLLSPMQLAELQSVVSRTGDDPQLDEQILGMILTAGARPQDVLDLTLGALDEEECTVRLSDRFGLTAYQPLPDWFVTTLLEFARSRGAEQPEDAVFRYRLDGRRGGIPISRRRFDYVFDRVREHLPWANEAQTSGHALRRHAITAIERSSSRAVAAAFGRTRLDCTGRHVAVRPVDVAQAVVAVRGGDHPWLHRSPRRHTA